MTGSSSLQKNVIISIKSCVHIRAQIGTRQSRENVGTIFRSHVRMCIFNHLALKSKLDLVQTYWIFFY